MKTDLLGPKKKSDATEALVGLFLVVLGAALVCALYFGRALLMPLALAGLLTFMVAPLISFAERWMKRVPAIVCVMTVVFLCVAGSAWVISRQALDVIASLPAYTSNVEQKLKAIELSKDGPTKRFLEMVNRIEGDIPGTRVPAPPVAHPTAAAQGKSGPEPRPVPAAAADSSPLGQISWLVGPVLGVLGTTGVVLVLVLFMLLKREDLNDRVIKMIGGGRISSASRTIEDAGARVAQYLLTQLTVNVTFGVIVAGGLYFIGVPNAFLWGALAASLRFIPYIGVWIAACCPVVLALAISPGWQMVFLTFGLFAALELLLGNVIEPLLYRSSTGVSSLALIVAAIFWTWIWGPMGLLLSTPLTVCIAVVGRHVPRFAFFNTLLGNEQALSAGEQCYHRLLIGGVKEAAEIAELHVGAHSITSLYDEVLIPTVTMAELDFQREELEEKQQLRVLQGVQEIIDDLSSREAPESKIPADEAVAAQTSSQLFKSDCQVVCLPTRGARDELAGSMLVHLLHEQGFDAALAHAGEPMTALMKWVEEQKAEVACISVIPPSTLLHARQLCKKLRMSYPKLRIIVCVWGATEGMEQAVREVRASGADECVVSMAEAVVQIEKFSNSLIGEMVPAAVPLDEEQRLLALIGLKAYASRSNPEFDRMTKQITRTFAVPVALVTLIDREQQHFKSQCGLPSDLSGVTEVPRDHAVCSHVVASNDVLIVQDLARDRRFANNPLLKQHKFRFYAGVPLRAPNGQPVGALCILDIRPRIFGESDKRLLVMLAQEISDGLAAVEVVPEKPEAVVLPQVRTQGA